MKLTLIHAFVFLPLVSSFSTPLPKSQTRLLLRQAVSDHSQQSDLFIEELTWAEEREIIVKPDDDWIVHEFNSPDTLAKEHHEWFSEALTPSSAKPSLRDEENRSDLHEWFSEEIEWLKSAEPKHNNQGVARRANKNDILNDHQRELVSFQMAHSVPKPAPIAPPITKDNMRGGDWFSSYVHEN